MISWPAQGWIQGRKCDVPDCGNDSLAVHCLKAQPALGPVLDRPLYLFFCEDHKDFETLVERYSALLPRRGAARSPQLAAASAGQR